MVSKGQVLSRVQGGALRMPGFHPGAPPKGSPFGNLIRVAGLVVAGLGLVGLIALSQPRTGFGRVLMALHLPGLAVPVFEDPPWRAAALYEAGRYDEAIALFRAGGARARYNLGNALARSGDLPGAVEAYDDALRFNPRDADAQANRALVARMLEEAIDRGPGGGLANGTAQYGARYNKTTNRDPNDDTAATSSGEGLAGNREASSSASLPGNSAVSRRGRAEQAAIDAAGGKARGAAGDAAGRGRSGTGPAMVAEAPEREARRVTKSFEAHEIRPDRLWLQTLPDDPGRYLRLRLKAEQTRRVDAGTAMPAGSNPW